MINTINHLHNLAILFTFPYAIILSTIIINLKRINLYIIYNPFTFIYSNIDLNILLVTLSGILYVFAKKEYYFKKKEKNAVILFLFSFLLFSYVLKKKNKYTILGRYNKDDIENDKKTNIENEFVETKKELDTKEHSKNVKDRCVMKNLKLWLLKLFLNILQLYLIAKTFYESLYVDLFEYTTSKGLFPLLYSLKDKIVVKSYKNAKNIHKQLLMYTIYLQLFIYIFGNVIGFFYVLCYFLENAVLCFLYFSFVYFLETVYVYNSTVNLRNYNVGLVCNKEISEKNTKYCYVYFNTLHNFVCSIITGIYKKIEDKFIKSCVAKIVNHKFILELYNIFNKNAFDNENRNEEFIVAYFLFFNVCTKNTNNEEITKKYIELILQSLKSEIINIKNFIEQTEKKYNAKVPGKTKTNRIGLLESYKVSNQQYKRIYFRYEFIKNQLIFANKYKKIGVKNKYEIYEVINIIEKIENYYELGLETQSLYKIIEEIK